MSKQHHSDDKLVTVYYKAVDFFEKNKKHVYTALTILVIAIAGIVILVNKRKANNENAGLELGLIKNIYAANNYQQAINGDSLGQSKGLKYIVDEYGSTDNGQTAKIMLANCYYGLLDYDNAEKYYKDYSGSNNVLKVAAAAGIASVYEAKGNYKDAAAQFEKAAGIDSKNPFIDQYLFYAAKNYYRINDNAKAKSLFAKLKEDYPKSKYIGESERYKSAMTSDQ